MNCKLVIGVSVAVAAGACHADITLDGIMDGNDTYSSMETVSWFNGHQTNNSIYGDFNNQTHVTQFHYGTGLLDGDNSGTQYFFLHIEAPLYAKNMIWQNLDWQDDFPLPNTDPNVGLTEDDVASYRVHHETHHNPGDMKLDFNGATGSEKLVLVDGNGNSFFEADLAGNADNAYGLVDSMDSSDYLLDNNLATMDLSLNRSTTMSFELVFELDANDNNAILDAVRNGIEFHLSPERGLIPAPSSLAMLALGGIAVSRRRR